MKSPDLQSKRFFALKPILLLLSLAVLAVFVFGCATPEGGSSRPWTEPEPWESQPRFGVPF